jgi:GAF domain-containing protein
VTLLSPDTPPDTRGAIAPSRLTDTLTHFVRDLSDSALTVGDLYERLADTARALIGVEGSCVLEVEPDGYRVAAPSGITAVCRGHLFTLDTLPPLFRQVLLSGTAAYDNGDTAAKQSSQGQQFPIDMRQLAATPIVLDERVQGLLVSVNHHDARFRAEDVALMGYLAAHGALVMRSRALVQQAEHAADDARTRAAEAARAAHVNAVLVKTARALANATSREVLFAGLAEVLVQELGAVGIGVYDADPLRRTLRLEYQWGSASTKRSRVEAAFWHTPLAEAVLQASPVFIEDLRREDPDSDIGQALIEAGIFAVALIPLVLEERTQGVLAVRFPGTRQFDDADRALLRDLTTQVALAFRTTIQFGEIERRADRLALLARAQQQLTPLISTEQLPTAIAEAVHLVIPCQIVEVLSLGEDGLQRLVRIEDGQVRSSAPSDASETELARETSLTGIPRLASCFVPVPGLSKGTVELCAPVRAGRRDVGVIRLVDTRSDLFALQDLDLLTIMARHAGTAVESARLFALQEFQRQRAEGAAEVARVTLQATTLAEGTAELLQVLDRLIPSNGKALGVARARWPNRIRRHQRHPRSAQGAPAGEHQGHRPVLPRRTTDRAAQPA